MKKIFLPLFVTAASAAIVLSACSKDSSSENTTLKIKLTDAPVNADEVNVDIQQVRVNFRSDSSGWVNMNTVAGVYDLLGLQNGVDTLLASGTIPSNSVQEIRFVLGSNNSIKVNGVVYPLSIPSGAESGLKIKVNKTFTQPLDSLVIDFDAGLSVHQLGNGNYQLRPVLRVK